MKLNIIITLLFVLSLGFIDDNKVVRLKNGLSYKDLVQGSGESIKYGQIAVVSMKAWVGKDSADYTQNNVDTAAIEIINTDEMNGPIKLILGEKQLSEALDTLILGMKKGTKRVMLIPPSFTKKEQSMGMPAGYIKAVMTLEDIKLPVEIKQWKGNNKMDSTKSGLKYEIIQNGNGENVKAGDTVVVHYSGFLENGKKFDSSVERDEPFRFVVGMGQVIKGWDEGLQLLNKGAKAKLHIPAELGYGSRDLGVIPSNSNLIFDVEVIDILRKK